MEKMFDCAMDIGEQMLTSGAEVHRVEESIQRMCLAFGAARVDAFVIITSMVVTIYMDHGESCTQTRRITSVDADFEKLHRLNQLSRRICAQNMTEQEIRAELEEIMAGKRYSFKMECFFCAVVAGAFTLFFGGTLTEALLSLLAGGLVRFCIWLLEKRFSNKIFSKFLSTALATFLAFSCVRVGWIDDVDKIIIGNIMTLIPGIGLTNALRDLFTGDAIAGILRCIDAVLTALAIVAGYFLVAVLGGFVA